MTENPTTIQRTSSSGAHPVHVTHLVFGLLFLGLVSAWAAVETGVVASSDLKWLIPLPWVAAGAIGLIAAGLAGRRDQSLQHPASTSTTASTTASPTFTTVGNDYDQEIS